MKIGFPSPFRGLYLQILGGTTLVFASSVSVPIPGTISPNCNLYWYKNVLDIKRFRPHSGDYISKSAKVSGIYNSWVKGVSVPIPGTISPNNVYSNHKVNNKVSVPIPGTISPNKLFKQKNGWRYCFRPHSGDYISKYCPLHPLYFFILRSIMRGKVNCIWKYSFNG